LDPISQGGHCLIGGGPFDFLVTSTLASQSCPAVGRAMGASLAHALKVPSIFDKNMVSFVSLGDGSVNNSHFLSAANLAEYAYVVAVVLVLWDAVHH
jgi:TPP-dependent pyruvate/acetoin dehydrogenase alpha subunit